MTLFLSINVYALVCEESSNYSYFSSNNCEIEAERVCSKYKEAREHIIARDPLFPDLDYSTTLFRKIIQKLDYSEINTCYADRLKEISQNIKLLFKKSKNLILSTTKEGKDTVANLRGVPEKSNAKFAFMEGLLPFIGNNTKWNGDDIKTIHHSEKNNRYLLSS